MSEQKLQDDSCYGDEFLAACARRHVDTKKGKCAPVLGTRQHAGVTLGDMHLIWLYLLCSLGSSHTIISSTASEVVRLNSVTKLAKQSHTLDGLNHSEVVVSFTLASVVAPGSWHTDTESGGEADIPSLLQLPKRQSVLNCFLRRNVGIFETAAGSSGTLIVGRLGASACSASSFTTESTTPSGARADISRATCGVEAFGGRRAIWSRDMRIVASLLQRRCKSARIEDSIE